jgi:hypothetical protein
MLNNDVHDMLGILGPEESYFDDLYEWHALFDFGRVFLPPPISADLHKQSTPNGDYDESYTTEHNTKCLPDTGPPRPIVVTESSQKIAKKQRTRMGPKRMPGSSAKPRRSVVQVLESVQRDCRSKAAPGLG